MKSTSDDSIIFMNTLIDIIACTCEINIILNLYYVQALETCWMSGYVI